MHDTKTASETLREAGDMIQAGWSPNTPTKQDAEGNITHRCAETAMASVHRGSPKAWRFLKAVMQPFANAASCMGGINVPGLVNCQPDMTHEKMVGIFRAAEAKALAAGE